MGVEAEELIVQGREEVLGLKVEVEGVHLDWTTVGEAGELE